MVVLLLTSSLQDYLRKNQLPGNGIVAFFSSIMARSPDKIKNIDGSKETLKLSMRITDLWFIGTPNKSEQAEMVFVDSDCVLEDLPFRKYRFARFADVVAGQFEPGLLVALDKLLGYELAFKIKVQPKFRNSVVLKCSTDSSLINVVMDMLVDAELDDRTLQNLFLLEIEQLLQANQRSLRDYPSMSYLEDANCPTYLDNSFILAELNDNNQELRSDNFHPLSHNV
ncbi:hypothetical protein JHK85_040776 [Glycine max]|nr:hypothetical protein JHK85_040776 [Glycine max]